MYDLRNHKTKESDGYFVLGASCPYLHGSELAQLKRSVWDPVRLLTIGAKWVFLPGANWARATSSQISSLSICNTRTNMCLIDDCYLLE